MHNDRQNIAKMRTLLIVHGKLAGYQVCIGAITAFKGWPEVSVAQCVENSRVHIMVRTC